MPSPFSKPQFRGRKQRKVANASPTLDFFFPATTEIIKFQLINILPATNVVNVTYLFTSNGGGFWDTSSIYDNNLIAWLVNVGVVQSNTLQASGLLQANLNSLASFGCNGNIVITNLNGGYKSVTSTLNSMDAASGNRPIGINNTNTYRVLTPINGIRFQMSSGAIASGVIIMEPEPPITWN